MESRSITVNANLTPKSLHALRRMEQLQQRIVASISGAGFLIAGVQLLNHGHIAIEPAPMPLPESEFSPEPMPEPMDMGGGGFD